MRISSLALLAALCLAQFSCSDDDGPGQFRYPLKVGNTWNYTRTWSSGPDMDSLNVILQEPIRVTIGARENLAVVGPAYRMDIEHLEDPNIAGAGFYQNDDAGLWIVAGCASGANVTPKTGVSPQLAEVLKHLDLAASLICDEPPRIDSVPDKSIAYPIRVGQRWLFRSVPEVFVTIEKRVAGWNEVEVPAGTFNAYRYEWIYNSDFELSIVDDIAYVGLIRRQMFLRIPQPSVENPTDTTTELHYELLELDSLKL